jgi:hypothetical protein
MTKKQLEAELKEKNEIVAQFRTFFQSHPKAKMHPRYISWNETLEQLDQVFGFETNEEGHYVDENGERIICKLPPPPRKE